MEIIKKDFGEKSPTVDMFKLLKGTVFHLTSMKSFKDIEADGLISGNQIKKNTGSEGCYARNRGYVSLFDFRKSDSVINEYILRYDGTLVPHWFEERTDLEGGVCRIECNVAYFVLAPKHYGELKLAEEAIVKYDETEKSEQKISEIECWFTRDLPLDYIEKVFLIKSYRIPRNDSNCLAELVEIIHSDHKTRED